MPDGMNLRGRRARTALHDGPHHVDLHVGQRIRLRRTMLGISQDSLGEKVGVTFQQLQKYERGVNRVSSSRLFQVAQALDVPISFFFDGLEEGRPVAEQSKSTRRQLEMGKLIPTLSDRDQIAVYDLVKALSRSE